MTLNPSDYNFSDIAAQYKAGEISLEEVVSVALKFHGHMMEGYAETGDPDFGYFFFFEHFKPSVESLSNEDRKRAIELCEGKGDSGALFY